MDCPRCHTQREVGAGFCPDCGTNPPGIIQLVNDAVDGLREKDYETAQHQAERALQLSPSSKDLHTLLAHAFFHRDKLGRAEELYQDLGEPFAPEVVFNLGQIALRQSRFTSARRYLETLTQEHVAVVKGEYYFGFYFENSMHLLAECQYLLALVCWNTHELDAAEYYFKQTLEYQGDHLRALKYLGNLNFQRENYSLAREYYRRCIDEFNEENSPPEVQVEIYHNLALTLEAVQQTEEAALLFNQVLNIRPGHPGAVYNLNRIYHKMGMYEAREDLHAPQMIGEDEGASRIFELQASSDENDDPEDPNRPLQVAGRSVIGRSQAMKRVLRMARLASASDSTVLVTGENGTGKELIARIIYEHSARSDAPFLAMNCAAIPESLIESELFGHSRGAFTGAVGEKLGYFRAADGGTILLDEIGDLNLNMQVKLLRVLQERSLMAVGSEKLEKVDVRIIASTNRELEAMVRNGKFRQDLYYRINVVPIHVPPLRERREDIPLLAAHFIRKYSKGQVRPDALLTDDDLHHLMNYDWPGNVRELENIIERGIVLGARYHTLIETHRQTNIHKLNNEGDELSGSIVQAWGSKDDHSDRPKRFDSADVKEKNDTDTATMPWEPVSLNALERDHIIRTLDHTKGNRTKAAKLLGINPTTLWRKMKNYELENEDDESEADAKS